MACEFRCAQAGQIGITAGIPLRIETYRGGKPTLKKAMGNEMLDERRTLASRYGSFNVGICLCIEIRIEAYAACKFAENMAKKAAGNLNFLAIDRKLAYTQPS